LDFPEVGHKIFSMVRDDFTEPLRTWFINAIFALRPEEFDVVEAGCKQREFMDLVFLELNDGFAQAERVSIPDVNREGL